MTLGHNFVDYVKMPMSNDERKGKVKGIRAKRNAKTHVKNSLVIHCRKVKKVKQKSQINAEIIPIYFD